MGKPIPTGNILFDQFWEAYPFRNARKIGKRKCIAKFKLKNEEYTPEVVQLMLDWIKLDIENRETVRSKGQWYADPCDPIVFLNGYRWEEPIGAVISKTVHREARRSKAVYGNNVKELIRHWEGVIMERTIQELVNNPRFMAGRKYPEFRAWALVKRPDLKRVRPDKADNPPCPPLAKLGPTPKSGPEMQKTDIRHGCCIENALPGPTSDADLPPPMTKKQRIIARVQELRRAKADGRIEKIVQRENLF